jgi:hypothetical protein
MNAYFYIVVGLSLQFVVLFRIAYSNYDSREITLRFQLGNTNCT